MYGYRFPQPSRREMTIAVIITVAIILICVGAAVGIAAVIKTAISIGIIFLLLYWYLN